MAHMGWSDTMTTATAPAVMSVQTMIERHMGPAVSWATGELTGFGTRYGADNGAP